MSSKRASSVSPLNLLQQMSASLVEHLEKACAKADKQASILLGDLEKERGKVQKKLSKARTRLDEAAAAGKSKAHAKAQLLFDELDESLHLLQYRQNELLAYVDKLKSDSARSLELAKGISDVERAAHEALTASQRPPVVKAPSRKAQAATPGKTRPTTARISRSKAVEAPVEKIEVQVPTEPTKPVRSRSRSGTSPINSRRVAKPKATPPQDSPSE